MNQKDFIEKILQLFGNSNDFLKLNEIAKTLKISSDGPEYIILKTVLNDLCTQRIIQKSSRRRYSLIGYNKFSTIEGKIKITRDSGFVVSNIDPQMKIRIKKKYFNTAFNGDTVLVRILGSRKNNKPRGEIVKILERNDVKIQGTIEFYDNIYFFIPKEECYYVDFLINPKKLNGAKDGDKVKVRILYWDNPLKSPQAEVVSILKAKGIKSEIHEEYDSIVEEFNLPVEFDDHVKAESIKISKPDIKKLLKERLDLRKDVIITIDPFDAKDFDDALSLKMLDNGNQLLGVHIADVSYFVRENTALDKEAFNRGNSVYLVDRVVPMLPEELSNDLCSLKPNVIRLAFSVFMELTSAGVVVDYKIAESIIKSKRRFTYEEVLEIIETGQGDYSELITSLHKLTVMLRANRFAIGGVDFESLEFKFKLDKDKLPVEALARVATSSTQLVEECMLLANKTVAQHITFLSRKNKLLQNLPFLYRVHDKPVADKLNDNLEFLKTLGAKFNIRSKSSKEINRIVKLFDNKPEKHIVHQIMLRAMAKAIYTSKNIGHFGLGFNDYAHFTSPIRRYPDLIVHRLIKEYAKAIPDRKKIPALIDSIENIGSHCTETEREAMDAERACIKLTQSFMARKYLGNEMGGVISGVTNFGLFIMIDEFYGEGMLHTRDLRDDYYYFDEKNFRLVGKKRKKVYKLGDRVKVRIIHVNIENRKIELDLI